MVGSSILPVCIHKNKLFFLFGKESTTDQAPGWSDFGGGIESPESPYETAMREGGEELKGFLGDGTTIKKHIKTHGGYYHINHKDQYHIHVINYPYDENLPKYYNDNHEFLWKRMNTNLLKRTKLFEKMEIKWFSISELRKRKLEFRKFYQEIVENILSEIPNIKRFLKKKNKNTKHTKCNKKHKRTIKLKRYSQ